MGLLDAMFTIGSLLDFSTPLRNVGRAAKGYEAVIVDSLDEALALESQGGKGVDIAGNGQYYVMMPTKKG